MKLSIVCILVAVSGTVWAQESSSLPDAPAASVVQPAAKRIAAPTRLRFALEGADGLLRGLDGYSTRQLLTSECRCYHEMNPIAPKSGDIGPQVAFQAVAGMAVIGGSRWLERRGHPKWARALLIADIVSEAIAVGHNFAIAGKKPEPTLTLIPSKPSPADRPIYR